MEKISECASIRIQHQLTNDRSPDLGSMTTFGGSDGADRQNIPCSFDKEANGCMGGSEGCKFNVAGQYRPWPSCAIDVARPEGSHGHRAAHQGDPELLLDALDAAGREL